MADPTILRAGGYQGDASVHTKGLRALAAALAPDDFATTVTPDVTAQGRKAASLLSLVETGALELCYFNSSYLAERVPAVQALDLPFAIRDRDHAWRLLDGALGRALRTAIEAATGYRVLAFWDNGFRHLTNRVRPIRTVSDCAGLRLRTVGSALHHEIFSALGFVPVPVDVKDLPQAVASGHVDAQENPLTNTVNFSLQTHHPHISLTAHFFGVVLLLANRTWVDALPAPRRDALARAVASATATQRALAAGEDAVCRRNLDADGCHVVEPAALDLAGFDAAVAPIRARVLADLPPAIAAFF
jgi:TRAP-type C4-dicarboxylate transport system substrate-binding protein